MTIQTLRNIKKTQKAVASLIKTCEALEITTGSVKNISETKTLLLKAESQLAEVKYRWLTQIR